MQEKKKIQALTPPFGHTAPGFLFLKSHRYHWKPHAYNFVARPSPDEAIGLTPFRLSLPPSPNSAASPRVAQMDTVGSRVIPLTDESDLWKRHFASADMVIEAVPESLDLKHR